MLRRLRIRHELLTLVGVAVAIPAVTGSIASAETARAGARLGIGVTFAGAALAILVAVPFALDVWRKIGQLAAESGRVSEAVARGQLAVRADPGRVDGDFRGVVDAINRTLDGVAKPMRFAAESFSLLSRGAMPPTNGEKYEGELGALMGNLDACSNAVRTLVADLCALAQAAIDGDLSARGDAAHHAGEFSKVMTGVNTALDALLEPVCEVTTVLERLACRDLRVRVEGSYRGGHARIKDALNATVAALHGSVSQVAHAASEVSSSATEIASSTEVVAAGAATQVSSLQQTAASLDTISSVTKTAASEAQQANGLAQDARTAAIDGGTAVEQMTTAMAKIRASAESTSQIIKDINEIAFQTNLLALNAAVEAARAGAAGRGFAVVAEEVRSLALRSKEAANKTEALIRESVRQAGEGELTAKQVSAKLGEIRDSVVKVSDIVVEIAAAANEQAVGLDEVSSAVTQVSQVTQQNATTSKRSSSAATALTSQFEELGRVIAMFQLHDPVADAEPRRRSGAQRPARTAAQPST